MCNKINIVRLGFKKQPKLTKDQPFVNFFNFVKNSRNDSKEIFYSHFKAYRSPLKNSVRFERKFVQLFHTMWGFYVCNEINIVRLGFKKQPKLTKEQPFVNFFSFVKNSRHDSNENFYSHSKPY